jgi:hypothetical protein
MQQWQALVQQNAHIERALRHMELLAAMRDSPPIESHAELVHKQLTRTSFACESTACSSGDSTESPRSDILLSDGAQPERIPKQVQNKQTTIIVRNIVRHCTRMMLAKYLDSQGYMGKYNLLYLPQRFEGKGCFHYAFVNFLSHSVALDFRARFHRYNDPDLTGEMHLQIEWADCQGLQANIEKFRNSSVMHSSVEDECKPLLLKNGKALPFPKPTKKIKLERRNRKDAYEVGYRMSV